MNTTRGRTTEDADHYQKMKRTLSKHFLSKKSKYRAIYTFRKHRTELGESERADTTFLLENAKDCKFGEKINDRTLEHLIQSIRANDVIEKSIKKKWPGMEPHSVY